MMFLCLIFVSPVYFMVRGKWGGFFINAILYGLACLCIISIVGIMFAPVFWALALGHAAFSYRREMMEHHATMLATKMAEKMRETPKA